MSLIEGYHGDKMTQEDRPKSRLKIWLTAVRPFAYPASVSAVMVGLGLVFFRGFAIHWVNFAITLFGVVMFHTAANLLNDVYDFHRGVDTVVLPVSGAVVRGWLSKHEAKRGAMVFLALGIASGLYLTYAAGLVVLMLGLIGFGLSLLYTREGFCLKYAAMGDATIFINFGILPVFGTYWVLTREFSLLPILWSLPVVLITVGILHANNWRDIKTDSARKCRTMASGMDETGSSQYYKVLVMGPFVLVIVYVLAGLFIGLDFLAPAPLIALLVFLAFPTALRLAMFKKEDDMQTFMMLDGKTAQLQTKFSFLLTIGLFASGIVTGFL